MGHNHHPSIVLPLSLTIIFGSFSLGFYVAIQGPTLMDLIDLLHVNNDIMSHSLAVASLAYSVGGLLSGLLFNYVDRQILIPGYYVVFGLSNICTPYITNYYIFSVVTVFKMMCAGGTDCGANVWILDMWPGKDAWLQALHFSFAVGCALGPLVVEPFLSAGEHKEGQGMELAFNQGSAMINNESTESRIWIPYGVSGSFSLLAAFLIVFLYFLESKRKRADALAAAHRPAAIAAIATSGGRSDSPLLATLATSVTSNSSHSLKLQQLQALAHPNQQQQPPPPQAAAPHHHQNQHQNQHQPQTAQTLGPRSPAALEAGLVPLALMGADGTGGGGGDQRADSPELDESVPLRALGATDDADEGAPSPSPQPAEPAASVAAPEARTPPPKSPASQQVDGGGGCCAPSANENAASPKATANTTSVTPTPTPTSTPAPPPTPTQHQQAAQMQQQMQLQQQQQLQMQMQLQRAAVKFTSKAREGDGRPPYYVMLAIALSALCLSFYCGIEITSMNYLATFAVNIDLQLPKSSAALMSSALTISFAVGRLFGIWIAAYMRPHKLFYLCSGVMALGNVFILIFANTAEYLLWASVCLFGIGCGPMYASIVSFYDDKISKVTNTVSGIFILGSMFNVALNTLIIGHYIIDNALILIVCNLIGAVLLLCLFGSLHALTRIKKNQRKRKFKLQQLRTLGGTGKPALVGGVGVGGGGGGGGGGAALAVSPSAHDQPQAQQPPQSQPQP